jgi:hypothetical protein
LNAHRYNDLLKILNASKIQAEEILDAALPEYSTKILDAFGINAIKILNALKHTSTEILDAPGINATEILDALEHISTKILDASGINATKILDALKHTSTEILDAPGINAIKILNALKHIFIKILNAFRQDATCWQPTFGGSCILNGVCALALGHARQWASHKQLAPM